MKAKEKLSRRKLRCVSAGAAQFAHFVVRLVSKPFSTNALAYLTLLVAFFTLLFMQWQYSNQIQGEISNQKLKKSSYVVALTIEVQHNEDQTASVINEYKKDKQVLLPAQYSMDIYEAGLQNGNLFLLNPRTVAELVDFNNGLPHYNELIKTIQSEVDNARTQADSCNVNKVADCSAENSALTNVQNNEGAGLNILAQDDDKALNQILAGLK